jgi:organic hydroperoxide reductase OsmC/OhrA
MGKVLYTAEAYVTGGRVTGHGRTSDGAPAVELAVTLPSVEGEDAVELVRAAHEVCPYSNATRGNIDVSLSANGAPVDV